MTPTEPSSQTVPTITLNDEHTIPVVGLGVAELSEEETERAVAAALDAGYRLIDTAAAYGNEEAVGRAVAASGIPREELFITTKVATQDQGFSASKVAFQRSLERLGLDYVDMYMIHWPAAQLGKYVDTYGALQVLQQDDLIRSVGVCNFLEEQLSTIIELTYTSPAVNQIELHPLLNQTELRRFHSEHDIVTEAYSPLGVGNLLDNPTIGSIAQAYGKSPAQVCIRWSVQLGNVVIPRSGNPERIKSNIEVFDFELTADEMAAINALDDGTRFRQDPATYIGT
ncbi:MAG: aldo/keto reductase, diketogulonate reductase [Glaciihabitans sp.]|jgi:2,5-diketo-D-gluconate reductase A|nr:aldo/keto reductase, diketogulonate reductase [Glaciihabitans sp.]MCW2654454.1 aldo/keto reductase, diketogulonate reductase [Mycobacterium sp.]